MAFLGQEEQIREFQDRFRYIYAIVLVALGLLLSRMVFLQILQGEAMRQLSESNRIRRVKVTAPRGMIFDRNRKLLIDNRPAFDLEIVPQYLRESKQTKPVVARLARLIKVPEAQIYDQLERARGQQSYLPVKIKTDLTRDEVAEIESWKIEMPGVEVREEIKRTNVHGEIASHLLGYIGEVNSSELPILNKNGKKYSQGDVVGKFGLEQRFEDVVRGVDGEELKEVDALGRIKLDKNRGRVLGSAPDKPALPGKNLVLTIDQDLQNAAYKAFGDHIGSMVAIDPRSGEILAMMSLPSFDPSEFSRGIPAALWAKLTSNPNHPLRDKTIQDHYSPGSTFKIVTAIAGLEEGVIDENTHIACAGKMRVGNRDYHCWSRKGHGSINVVSAITHSCDIFFYRTAQRFKSVDDLAKWAIRLGMGRKTGINLAREVPGLIPTEEWKMKRFHQEWNAGETLSVAIGQSYVLTTALQLANVYASIANGGTQYRPFLVKEIESYEGQVIQQTKPDVVERHTLKPKTMELIRQGLWGVVNTPGGTAYSNRLPGMDFVGKTGTVQTHKVSADKIYQKCENLPFRERHHGLFAGFAPLNNPVIAVGVIMEHACHGTAGATVTHAVIKTYLEKYFPEVYGEKALAARLKALGTNNPAPMPMPNLTAAPAAPSDSEDVTVDGVSESADEEAAEPPPVPAIAEPNGPVRGRGTEE